MDIKRSLPTRISWLRAIALISTHFSLGIILERLMTTDSELSFLQFGLVWIGSLMGAALLMIIYHYCIALLLPWLRKKYPLMPQVKKETSLKEGIRVIQVSLSMEVILSLIPMGTSEKISREWLIAISLCAWIVFAPLMYEKFTQQSGSSATKKPRKKSAKSPKQKPK
ncbi:hypothetical protein [Kamptonema sp. UHCC 0994]|uniref:hypothetical protein n=1 Tax=Kamptonema sp. UHCC 0994 TaxID=3031329 RepID=UPI0023B999BD|nr:hypothetical protein [Kamptonema sp. UHCC 0994]MDF0553190.1 hypothetical protein [Kamptonema sp. UHCC 0994]